MKISLKYLVKINKTLMMILLTKTEKMKILKIKNSKRNISFLSNLEILKLKNRCIDQLEDKYKSPRKMLLMLKVTTIIIYGMINTSLIEISKLRKRLLFTSAIHQLILALQRQINSKRKAQPISVYILLEVAALKV